MPLSPAPQFAEPIVEEIVDLIADTSDAALEMISSNGRVKPTILGLAVVIGAAAITVAVLSSRRR